MARVGPTPVQEASTTASTEVQTPPAAKDAARKVSLQKYKSSSADKLRN
jgi:hypothetical protein